MKILINYAHNKFYESQKKNTESGLIVGGFDSVIEYRYDDLPDAFKEKNHHILKQAKGAGYWVWKPQIILQTFEVCDEGDYVFYSDAGAIFIADVAPLFPICDANGGILLFHLTPDPMNCELVQTKRDAFILMDCDNETVTKGWPPIDAGHQLYKNCKAARDFVKECLYFCEDERIVTDLPNKLGENYPGHIAHRWDQSVVSCLQKKKGIKSYLDATQFGNDFRKPTDTYGQLIDRTRDQH